MSWLFVNKMKILSLIQLWCFFWGKCFAQKKLAKAFELTLRIASSSTLRPNSLFAARMTTTQTQKAPILPKEKTGIAVGLGRGYRITKRPLKERYRDVRKRVNNIHFTF
jgi:hypothetical protein